MITDTDLIERFAEQMKIELKHNAKKGMLIEFTNFEEIMTQLEYHKSKFMIAVRLGEMGAAKEYLADCGNFLAALGNSLRLFDEMPVDDGMAYELLKESPIIKKVKFDEQSEGNKIVN